MDGPKFQTCNCFVFPYHTFRKYSSFSLYTFFMIYFLCSLLKSHIYSIISWRHSLTSLSVTLYTAARHASFLHHLPELAQLVSVEKVMPSIHLILCHPLLLPPSIFPSIRIFTNESALCIRHSKYWSFSLSISLSNEYLGLITFRIDWLDLLAVQGTLKHLLQHHSPKASILSCSDFFMLQL